MQAVKKRFVIKPLLNTFLTDDTIQEDFAQILESTKNSIKEGSVVKGQVVGITKDIIIVDVGLKNEGRVPIEEFFAIKSQPIPQLGDTVEVYVEKIEGKNGKTVLSREKAIREDAWVQLERACNKGELVNGVIFGRVKGGFTVDLSGVVAFLPGSQVDVRPVKDISSLMNIEQPFQILKMDKKLGNIVVSRRAILEESRSGARDEMLATVKEGDILEGVIKNITDYGAFIDLGSVDGLLHVTDISWSRINHPSEALSLGQKIKVMVIKFNEDTKRISLGMKQLDDNPWQGIKKEFPTGKIMLGKVTNITDYGVFIELKDGIEGLVHTSEISWLKSNQHPKKLLTIGQEVQFVILEVDTEKHRISLSIKQCQENPLIDFAKNHPIGSVIKAPIRNITDFGIFVALSNNIDGMIHETDISWENNRSELLKSYKKGEEIECKVLFVDIDKERVSLGIKQINDQASQYAIWESKRNSTVTCTVKIIKDDSVEVDLDGKALGIIKKSELSLEKSDQKTDRFAINDRVDAKIISFDKQNNKVILSIRALELEDRERAIKEYGSLDSGASLGEILGATLGKNKNN